MISWLTYSTLEQMSITSPPPTPQSSMITDSDWQALNREQLRRLDDCLTVLEEAHEIELVDVTPAMVELLQPRVPSISIGMRIADAIEEVLKMQEPFMKKPAPQSSDRRKVPARKHHSYDINSIIGSIDFGHSQTSDSSFLPKRRRPSK